MGTCLALPTAHALYIVLFFYVNMLNDKIYLYDLIVTNNSPDYDAALASSSFMNAGKRQRIMAILVNHMKDENAHVRYRSSKALVEMIDLTAPRQLINGIERSIHYAYIRERPVKASETEEYDRYFLTLRIKSGRVDLGFSLTSSARHEANKIIDDWWADSMAGIKQHKR